MKESNNEGLANHIDPESCVDDPQGRSEALTGERASWVLSPEIDLRPNADALQVSRRQNFINRYGKGYEGLAGSEASCMYGNTLGGNREALHLTLRDCVEVRMENLERTRP